MQIAENDIKYNTDISLISYNDITKKIVIF